jgi:hypothetical protein
MEDGGQHQNGRYKIDYYKTAHPHPPVRRYLPQIHVDFSDCFAMKFQMNISLRHNVIFSGI